MSANLKFRDTHEWARLEDDGTVTVGISAHAQEALGDLVYIELPELDASFGAGDECAVVESVKAASDIYSPVGGKIIAINETLVDAPEQVNASPYDDGWLFRLAPDDIAEFDEMLSESDYAETLDD
ncbi:MAG: glycine cleavage system protein GcvH [Gammaproteobacteria bacterium]|nr:glycine cleavage system protein GcvH [Gammaproteobacteria bacterium]